MRKEGQEEGERKKGGRKEEQEERGEEEREEGRGGERGGEIHTGGPSHAGAHLITLRGAGALVAVGGAAGTLSCDGGGHSSPFGVVLGCSLCAVDAVARDVVVGADRCWGICGRLVVIVGMHICEQLVVVVHACVCRWLVVVVYIHAIVIGAFAFMGSWWLLWVFTFMGGWWSLYMFMFVGCWLLLWVVMSFVVHNVVVGILCCSCSWVLVVEVIVVGSGRGLSLLWLVLVRAVVVMCINGGGKEKGSHVTHHDNGITFDLPCEITCKCLM